MLDSCCQDTKDTMIWINNNIDNLYQIYKHIELGNNEVADSAHIFFITKICTNLLVIIHEVLCNLCEPISNISKPILTTLWTSFTLHVLQQFDLYTIY